MLINAVLFQLGWLVCVLERGWWAVLATATIVTIHARFNGADKREWYFVGGVVVWGFLQDFGLMQLQVLQVDNHALPPLWLVLIWVLFATTLNHSLKWLQSRLWLAALAGAIAAPLSYIAGERLGALRINTALLPALSLTWALTLPAMLWAGQRSVQRSPA